MMWLLVHVEEPSMKEALDSLLPRMLADRALNPTIIDHGSKAALLRDLPARLRSYRAMGADVRALALVDKDAHDCAVLKQQLEHASRTAGLATKTAPDRAGQFRVVNRIVVEELEAWFFGDIEALCRAYPGVPATLAERAGFRDPDGIHETWQTLLRVLQRAGHYQGLGRLPKLEVARRVAPLMRIDTNRSRSFQAFVTGFAAITT